MKTKSLFAGIAFFTALGQSSLHAQATWTSGSTGGDWATAANWTGTAPVNSGTTALTFDTASANRTYTNTLTSFTASSITVTSGSRDNNVTGNAINLTGTVTSGTGNWQTFNIDMNLGNAARTFAINSGRFYASGILSGTGSAGSNAAITKTGGGDLWLTNANTISGNGTTTVNSTIAGAGTYNQALLFSGGGSGTVVLNNTAALGAATNSVRFSGSGSGVLDLQTDTSVNAYSIFSGSNNGGTINVGRATAGAGITHSLGVLDLSSVTMTINTGSNVTSGVAGVSFTSLSMSGGNDNNPVTLAGSAAISIGTAGITNNTGTTRRLQLGGTNAGNTIGVISNLAPGAAAGAGVVNLIKSNSSTWTLSGNNTYTGITTIAGGTLQLGNGGGTGTLSSSSAIQNGGTLAFNRTGTITQGTDFAATISAYATDYSTNSAGVALGTPVLGKLVKSASGNLILNGANTLNATDSLTFSGNSSGTVTLRNTAALGSAGNSVRFSGGGSGVLDLQTDTSVNGYNIASGTFNGGTIIANRLNSGTAVSHALGALDLSSVTMTINKGGNVSGTAAVSFTELKMTGGNDNNPVTLAGSADIAIGSASITSTGISKRLQLDGTSASNSIGAITNTNNATSGAVVNVIKANSSTWSLTGTNTYTGTTTIKAGTLALGASASIDNTTKIIVGDAGSTTAVLDTTAKSGFTIASGQTLSGIGNVNVGSGNTLTILGTHAPGNSAGIETVTGNLAYGSTSIFEWELTSNTSTQGSSPNFTFDQVAVSGGTLAIASDAKFKIILNSTGSNVDFTNTFWSTNQSWSIFTGASAMTGFTLDSVTNDKNEVAFSTSYPNGSFSITGSTLTWSAVPEPTSALVGLLITAGLLRRRRCA